MSLPSPDDYSDWKEFARALLSVLDDGTSGVIADGGSGGGGGGTVPPPGFQPIFWNPDLQELFAGNWYNVPPPVIEPFQVDTQSLALASVELQILADSAVDTAKLADLAVVNAKIANATILSAKIGDLQVVTAKINDLAVNSAKILNGSILTAHIGNAQITAALIGNLAVGAAAIQVAAINSAHIQDAAVVNAKIGDVIQSGNWDDVTKVGWKIDKTGLIQGRALALYDNAGTLIFGAAGTLDWSRIIGVEIGGVNWFQPDPSFDAGVPAKTDRPDGGAVILSSVATTPYHGTKSLGVGMLGGHHWAFDQTFVAASPTVTVSIWARDAGVTNTSRTGSNFGGAANVCSPFYMGLYNRTTATWMDPELSPGVMKAQQVPFGDASWKRYSQTFTGLTVGHTYSPQLMADPYTGEEAIDLDALQIEYGNAPTAFTNSEPGATFGATFGSTIFGQITAGNISTYVGAAAISNAYIGNAAILTANIGTSQITSALIADATIATADIGDAQIVTAKIGAAQITTALIANAAITNALIGNAQISTAKIADLSVTTLKIADLNVTTNKTDYGVGGNSSIFCDTVNGVTFSSTVTWTDVASVTLTSEQGMVIEGHASSVLQDIGSTTTQAHMRLVRDDGTVIIEPMVIAARDEGESISIDWVDSVPASRTTTWTWQMKKFTESGESVTAKPRFMRATEHVRSFYDSIVLAAPAGAGPGRGTGGGGNINGTGGGLSSYY